VEEIVEEITCKRDEPVRLKERENLTPFPLCNPISGLATKTRAIICELYACPALPHIFVMHPIDQAYAVKLEYGRQYRATCIAIGSCRQQWDWILCRSCIKKRTMRSQEPASPSQIVAADSNGRSLVG